MSGNWFESAKPLICGIGENVFNSINMDGTLAEQICLCWVLLSHRVTSLKSDKVYFHFVREIFTENQSSLAKEDDFGLIVHFSKVSPNLVNVHQGSSVSQPTLHGSRTKKMLTEPLQGIKQKASFLSLLKVLGRVEDTPHSFSTYSSIFV